MNGEELRTAGLRQSIYQIPLFAALPEDEVQILEEVIELNEFPTGTILFHEGDIGDRFSIILDGQIEVINALGTPEERLWDLLGPGDFLGEMSAVFPNKQRSASARTLTQVKLLEITHNEFEALLHRQPALALLIMREMSTRLRRTEQTTIRDLKEKNAQLAKAYQDLKDAQAQLIEKEKIEYELAMARTIQKGMLPKEIPVLDGWKIQTYWQPARAVGGDFYDFISFPGGKMAVVIGDVTGKGIPAALVMANTCSILRAIASSLPPDQSPSPGGLLSQMNELLCKQIPMGMFVTCLLIVLDPVSGELVFANAGHCLPYLYADQQVCELHATGMPLGLLPGMNYDETQSAVTPRAEMILYSDGLIEAHDTANQMFGLARLREKIEQHPAEHEMIPYLIERFNEFTGDGREQEDDITILSVERLLV